ncbi:hypothetical protein RJZ90_002073 [Blastomyces dermatitidis]
MHNANVVILKHLKPYNTMSVMLSPGSEPYNTGSASLLFDLQSHYPYDLETFEALATLHLLPAHIDATELYDGLIFVQDTKPSQSIP